MKKPSTGCLWLFGLLLLFLCAVTFSTILPVIAHRLTDGRKSAALAACKSVVYLLMIADQADPPVLISDLSASEWDNFKKVSASDCLRDSKILVASNASWSGQVVAVCDVPPGLLGILPATHAVAYDNGRASLLSDEEFSRLDLIGIVDARNAASKKTEQSRRIRQR